MEREEKKETMALITAVHRERYEITIQDEMQKNTYARLKNSVYYQDKAEMPFPTVGDYVKIVPNETGDALIVNTQPRRTVFYRENPTPGMEKQAVAANFDYVFITMSMNHDFNQNRLDRYLTVAWDSGAMPVIILTKLDLCDEVEYYVNLVETQVPGVDVCTVSSVTGEGMDAVQKYLTPGKVAVILGSSGVGKSTFVNALCGEAVMNTGAIREDDSKGRHTTTYRQMIFLPGGARIIDTPGMRVLGVTEAEQGVDTAFSDIEQLAEQCRFRNCTHQKEAGCAIQNAITNGTLSAKRFENYRKIMAETAHAKRREEIAKRKQLRSVQRKKKPVRQKRFEY